VRAVSDVFFCGALQDPAEIARLIGRLPPSAPAVAPGFARIESTVDGVPMAFMVPAPDGPAAVLCGTVYLGLEERDLRAIEADELRGGHRVRVEVDVLVGDRPLRAVTWVKR
jgi:hypothetical protein